MSGKEETSALERQVFHLQTLYELSNALSNCRDITRLYKEVLSILMGTFGVEHGLMLVKVTPHEWRVGADRGFERDISPGLQRQVLSARFDGKKAAERKSLLLVFLQKQKLTAATENSVAWAEFFGRDGILGGVFLGEKLSGAPYSAADLELIEAAVNHAASALENLHLYEELRDAQDRLRLENIALREEVVKEYEGGRMFGQSEKIRTLLQQARNVAKSPANVLIYGETGTGKELLAKTIHYLGPRQDKPFVAINSTAIPENLVESELFGIEAGVATGVKKHIGYFEQADGGTLFIDEIGDMPVSSQAKILRVLQERCFRRVGGTKEISVDVRVIAATNKNLEAEMKEGNFREDLYFRLGVLELHLPSLRSRRDDIPLLVTHFVKKLQQRIGSRIQGFSTKAMKQLMQYEWPGNVRELENEVERALTLAGDGAIIQPEDLSHKVSRAQSNLELPNGLQASSLREAMDALETHLIKEALQRYRWNKSEVSRKLGISRLGLQKKIDRLGIYPEE
ncbi:MAG: sigma-54 interaction domain-containing protein [bacterium]